MTRSKGSLQRFRAKRKDAELSQSLVAQTGEPAKASNAAAPGTPFVEAFLLLIVVPLTAAALITVSWLLTVLARRWNRIDAAALFYTALAGGVLAALDFGGDIADLEVEIGLEGI